MESHRPASLLSGERDRHEEARSLLLRVLDGSVRCDPYPVFNQIREAGPLWWDESTVVFSSYRHCAAVLQAPETVARIEACPARRASNGGEPMLLTEAKAGTPEDMWLRRLVSQVLEPHRVRGLLTFVRDLVDELLDGVASRGRLEVVTDLAYPLPAAVLCRLMGLPQHDASWLHRQALVLSPVLDPHPLLTGTVPPGAEARQRAEAELAAYLEELVRSRATQTGEGPLSVLAKAAGDAPSAVERAAAACRDLLVAGHETSVDLVSNSILALLRAPHLLETVRLDARYAGQVVDEVLRLDPPVQVLTHHATADLDVCGIQVPAGASILLLLAAAHRDPDVYGSPDVFSPGATEVPHAAFGRGSQTCPGERVARIIAETTLTRFAQRATNPRFAKGSPTYRPTIALRSLRALWVDADNFGHNHQPWSTATSTQRFAAQNPPMGANS